MAQVLVKVCSNDSGKNNNIAAINGWFLTNDNELFPFIVKFQFYLGMHTYHGKTIAWYRSSNFLKRLICRDCENSRQKFRQADCGRFVFVMKIRWL